MRHARTPILVLLAALSPACMTDPRERSIGEAFVGPATLALRKELTARNESTSALKHGERLDLLQFRRRFVKVRNAGGVEGWVDSRNLLTAEQMDEMHRLAEMAATLPPQGKATVFDVLNVHVAPNRLSPSPWQMFPGAFADVVGHVVAKRTSYHSPVMEIAATRTPPPVPKRKRKKQEQAPAEAVEIGPPAMPAPPKPPADWQRLSVTGNGRAQESDDWTLVRSADNRAGYVLTRNLLMGMPDNLARYAGGHRIMAYFTLGETKDGGESKPHWLWATTASRMVEFQFDSFRVFAYNVRKHRYETVFWEKNVRGYYPITLETLQVVDHQQQASVSGFHVIAADSDGSRWKRTYGFQNGRVRFLKREPVAKPEAAAATGAIVSTSLPPLPPPVPSLVNQVKELLKK